MLPALPTGIARMSGARPRSSQTSNAAVFWPSRRNGLTELTSVTGWSSCSAQRAHDAQRVVEVAVDRDDPGPGDERLEQLAERDLAPRQDHDDVEPGCRPVGRGRRGRVPGRGADHRSGTGLEGLCDRHDHAPVLERAGRVLALDLEVQVRNADRSPEAGRADQRRGALAQA